MNNKNTAVHHIPRLLLRRSVSLKGIGAAHTLYPALQACGMTKCVAQGFTLIELLVVVLIMGILAAVALPQYNKAVEKARASEAILNLSALQKAVDLYVLEYGLPTGENTYITFLGIGQPENENDPTEYQSGNLGIDLSFLKAENCSTDSEGSAYCYNNHFLYWAGCHSEGCDIGVQRITAQTDREEDIYVRDSGSYLRKSKNSNGLWRKICGRSWCAGLTY